MADDKHPSGLTETEIWYRYTRYPPILAKFALYGLAITLVYVAFSAVEAVLFPVLLSLLIAYLLDPMIDAFEERGYSRTASILVFLGIGVGLLTLFTLFLYPTVAHQIVRLADNLPKLIQSLETDLIPWIETNLGIDLPDTLSAGLSTYGSTLQSQIPSATRALSTAFSQLWTQLGTVLASAVNVVMIPIFTFYFLRDFDRMRLSLVDFLPLADRDFYLDRIVKMDQVVGAWFRGQVEVASILAVLYAIGLAGVFLWAGVGASAGIGIGLLAGVLNIVPYFGFLIGFILSMAMVLLDWNGVGPVIGVVAVFALVQGLEGYVITPRIVGEKVGLSPVVVIIALLLGGEILGLVGILLALPIAGILGVLAPDFIAYYRSTGLYTGTVDPNGASMGFIEAARAAEAARNAKT